MAGTRAGGRLIASCRSVMPISSWSRPSTLQWRLAAPSGGGSLLRRASSSAHSAGRFGRTILTRSLRGSASRSRQGLEQAAAEPALPFFIEWAPGTELPGRARTDHTAGEIHIAEVRVSGDPHAIDAWLGAHHVPIDIRAGRSAITAVTMASASGDEIVFGTTES